MKTTSLLLSLAFALIAATLSGCGYTSYHVKRDDGTELRVLSTREFPDGVLVEYESAEGAKLKVDAGSVKSHESSASDALVQALLRGLQPLAPMPVPADADDRQ